jgi:hypothetical protein
MRIILSRKGLDSATGGIPSPILPDGQLLPLPIPEGPPASHQPSSIIHPLSSVPTTYAALRTGGHDLATVISDLTRGRIAPGDQAHLDPDLDASSMHRPEGWRPIFGQAGAAESHLQHCGVGPGDLFLFYGWFRAAERVGGRWRFVSGAPDQHILFGWLQIAERVAVTDTRRIPSWAAGHPHIKPQPYASADSIYLAAARLELPGASGALPGAGRFTSYRPALQLTEPGATRRYWRLPAWFADTGLTYHANPQRWSPAGDHVVLKTVGRGQEFVIANPPPEAGAWLRTLFEGESRLT